MNNKSKPIRRLLYICPSWEVWSSVINELEYDLKRKMNNLGIKLTREQIKVMTTRIDGDDLARSFAIFDVTTFIYSLLNSKLTFLSFIFFTRDINLPII